MKVDPGRSVAILANIGVLAGLLLLAFELNQNRAMTAAQTRHDIAQGIVDQLAELASNADLADLTHRARCGRLESPVEAERYFLFVNSRLRYWEDAHYQYRQGLFDEPEFMAQREAWRSFLQPAVTQEAWSRMKRSFSREFAAEIDFLIADSNDLQFALPNCG